MAIKSELQATLKEMDIDFQEDATNKELETLIEENTPNEEVKEEEKPKDEVVNVITEDVKEEEFKPEAKITVKQQEPAIMVYLPNGQKRYYSRTSHGKSFAILAKQLAENPKYKGAKVVKI